MKILPATPDTVHWGHFDPGAAPVLDVSPGEILRIETLSGGPRNLPQKGEGHVLASHRAVMAALKPDLGPHIMTGPVYITGAEPGDRLIVEILDIELAQDWGWNAVEPGFGLFPDLARDYASLAIPIDREKAVAALPWGVSAPLAPFFGILAVAPDPALGRIGSVVPGAFGGNIDNRLARVGSAVHFPVFREGALFSAGDGHALQGDGEVCDTALETALNGRFRFSVEKGTAPEVPEIHTPDLIVTMGFDPELNRAAEDATRRMMAQIMAQSPMDEIEAWRHCSLFAELRITQVVNRHRGVHCILSRATLPARHG